MFHIHFLFVLRSLINLKHAKFKMDACASIFDPRFDHREIRRCGRGKRICRTDGEISPCVVTMEGFFYLWCNSFIEYMKIKARYLQTDLKTCAAVAPCDGHKHRVLPSPSVGRFLRPLSRACLENAELETILNMRHYQDDCAAASSLSGAKCVVSPQHIIP